MTEARKQWEEAEELTRQIWDIMCFRENAMPDDPMFRHCPGLFDNINRAVRRLKIRGVVE